ncbi:kinesin-like protein KIF19 [Rhinophrynus dorsalis]
MKDGGESKDQQLTVALRIRPINETELVEGANIIAHKVDEQMVVLMDPMEDPDDILRANRSREKSYMFDVAFDYTATQDTVYRLTTKGLIEGVISGYNATVFAYGPTGCGKTYTMLGTDREPGIYIRTLNDLFRAIEETSDDMEYEVSMSYMEIYNEMIRDLLNPSLGYLDLREDSKGVIQVAGITEVSTINAKEIMQLLMKGNKQRTQEPTAANKTSSRSHAILQVTVRQKSRVKNITQEVRLGRLFMIDLAGSERASQTQNRGQRMKEGAHINRSLLALGNCINALSERGGNKYVNYRDSKLTRLLKDSLGGNSRTVMIAHISPASSAFEESRNTLTYADRAKNIKTRVKRNLLNVSYHIAQYTSIISDLRNEIQRLKEKIDEQGLKQMSEKSDIRNIQAEVQLHTAPYARHKMNQLREQLIRAFQEQMDIRRQLMEIENNQMEIQMETSRHFLIIADWEQEKTRRVRKWREELKKETYGKDDSEKDSDPGDDQSDIMEPIEVTMARENIQALVGDQSKLQKQKMELEKRFKDIRHRARRLEEVLPKRISSEEQREVLSLLCKVHELEIENTEMQSHALLKDNMIRQKNYMVQRFEQHRCLCEEIIKQQRQIINEHNLTVPHHLDDLYELYLRELEDCTMERITITDKAAVMALKGGQSSLPKLPQLTAAEENLQELDSDQESVRTFGSDNRNPMHRDSYRNLLPQLLSEADSDTNKVFKTSPRACHFKNSTVVTPPPIHVNGMISKEYPPRDSLVSISGHINSSPDSNDNKVGLTRKEKKEILTSIKNIAVKAARRRSRVLEGDRLQLLQPMKERSNLSVYSLSESEDQPFRDQQLPDSSLQHAASEDNLSSSMGEIVKAPRAGNNQRDSTILWQRAQKKGAQKLEKREESLEVKRRKKRSRSFEVTGQGLVRPKNHPLHNRALESNSEHKIQTNSLQAINSRLPGKMLLPIAQVKLPQNQAGAIIKMTEQQGAGHHLNQTGNVKKPITNNQRMRFNYVNANAGGNHVKEVRVRKH